MQAIFTTGTTKDEVFSPEYGANFINGNGGTDRVDYSALKDPITVKLHDGSEPSIVYVGTEPRDVLTDIDDITGGIGADHLIGNTQTNKFNGGPGQDTLDGGQGLDFAEYTGRSLPIAVKLSLESPSIVYVNGIAEDTLVNIENIIGGSGNDHLVGTDDYNLLLGGDGDDILEGKGFVDALSGGAGADTYVYRSFLDSTPEQQDWVADFNRTEGDRFEMSRMDANINQTGHQALTFSGNQAQPHSVWYECERFTPFANNKIDGYYVINIYADVDGDTSEDFAVTAYSPSPLIIPNDFIF
ncbi:calcium-binding protein [Haematospirillum sp. H1815]|uniref:calcium-binding protein n=1 Tax=Haematospirillum sp. H1815 TaxID=2723108 RepID=UPI00143C7315|nr:calcium-binding protein [Haematospirillum sp. H1815]NKD78148.1 calcium-binding protein [Haematospirillum sp. H1815]